MALPATVLLQHLNDLTQSFELQYVSCDELLRDQLITRVDSVLPVVKNYCI